MKIFSKKISLSKKLFILSKIMGLVIILVYLFANKYLNNNYFSLFVWVIFVFILIIIFDWIFGLLVNKPLDTINKTAHQMSILKDSAYCDLRTGDEFEELANNLNKMYEDLKKSNNDLKKKIDEEKDLLLLQKETVDILSHEMKTPISIIKAYVDGIEKTKENEKYISIINSEIDKLNNMIISLLDLSALERGSYKLDYSEFDFIESVEIIAGKLLYNKIDNIKLEYEFPENKLFIRADKTRIEEVVSNLISNAINHVLDFGKIEIKIKDLDKYILFSVYNDGDLIQEKNKNKIWTKFFKDNNSKGNGLGLAIAKQIIDMHKGEIYFDNKHKGVSFSFTLNK